jgi:hypothetical protein
MIFKLIYLITIIDYNKNWKINIINTYINNIMTSWADDINNKTEDYDEPLTNNLNTKTEEPLKKKLIHILNIKKIFLDFYLLVLMNNIFYFVNY